jgi:hypothetical protein
VLEADPNEVEKMREKNQKKDLDENNFDNDIIKKLSKDHKHISKGLDEDSMCSSSCASIDNDYKSATPKINADHDIF